MAAHFVHERALELTDGSGTPYRRALVFAEPGSAGTWATWLEFVSARGDKVLRTEAQPRPGTRNGLVYWASSLHPGYFEGALARASSPAAPARGAEATPGEARLVPFRVSTLDPGVAFPLIPTRTLVPGNRWEVHEGAAIIYVRALPPARSRLPHAFDFLARFRSDRGAEVLASRLAAELRATDAVLEVRRASVPIASSQIRRALLEPR